MTDPMPKRYQLSESELAELVAEPAGADRSNAFRPAEELGPLTAADFACFTELRAVLERHGMLERFGVTVLHKHFDLATNETLVETTDVAKRSMTIQPEVIDPSDVSAITTQWYLGNTIPLSVVKCRTGWH
jgi:hypothetical protein